MAMRSVVRNDTTAVAYGLRCGLDDDKGSTRMGRIVRIVDQGRPRAQEPRSAHRAQVPDGHTSGAGTTVLQLRTTRAIHGSRSRVSHDTATLGYGVSDSRCGWGDNGTAVGGESNAAQLGEYISERDVAFHHNGLTHRIMALNAIALPFALRQPAERLGITAKSPQQHHELADPDEQVHDDMAASLPAPSHPPLSMPLALRPL
ncbi:hypothetical protein BJ912DRAFT_972092 [Pholiota molesta]|nr:hypothetical protein BJ912DRAFT_972092 [Pholiota molesta]